MSFDSPEALRQALRKERYLADPGLATSLFLAIRLERPIFLEGEAGVGKTEVGIALAAALGTELIRLQCYEGLDLHQAAYEWNYTRQLLRIRLAEARDERPEEADLFGPDFLLRRPLLQAVQWSGPSRPVLLIDELDRSDEEFEAYLLEVLSDFQITIPEIGTLKAERPPIVVLTSNRTREVHDALKRRCLYAWIDYPDFDQELEILQLKLPKLPAELSRQITAFVQQLRQADLYKAPGVAETLDWAEALWALDQQRLDPQIVDLTLGSLLKYQDDLATIRGKRAAALVAAAAGD